MFIPIEKLNKTKQNIEGIALKQIDTITKLYLSFQKKKRGAKLLKKKNQANRSLKKKLKEKQHTQTHK